MQWEEVGVDGGEKGSQCRGTPHHMSNKNEQVKRRQIVWKLYTLNGRNHWEYYTHRPHIAVGHLFLFLKCLLLKQLKALIGGWNWFGG